MRLWKAESGPPSDRSPLRCSAELCLAVQPLQERFEVSRRRGQAGRAVGVPPSGSLLLLVHWIAQHLLAAVQVVAALWEPGQGTGRAGGPGLCL